MSAWYKHQSPKYFNISDEQNFKYLNFMLN